MKASLLFASALFTVSFHSFAQENEISETGNIGIGTTAPTSKLDVRGDVKIDSTLKVGDSLAVARSASISEDLTVTGKTYLKSDLLLSYLDNGTLTGNEFLLLDANGTVKIGGDLLTAVYADATPPCKDGNNGYTTPAHPTWANSPGKLYTNLHCVPDVKVGIGTNNPEAKLHIRLNDTQPGIDTHPLVVQQANGTKILQLNESGLLQAREIKVDLSSWPDYVFDDAYVLMPLDELAEYIGQNHHLPNALPACEMEQNGMNVSETNVLLMEKVEELTLYLIDLQQQLRRQQEEIDALRSQSGNQ